MDCTILGSLHNGGILKDSNPYHGSTRFFRLDRNVVENNGLRKNRKACALFFQVLLRNDLSVHTSLEHVHQKQQIVKKKSVGLFKNHSSYFVGHRLFEGSIFAPVFEAPTMSAYFRIRHCGVSPITFKRMIKQMCIFFLRAEW